MSVHHAKKSQEQFLTKNTPLFDCSCSLAQSRLFHYVFFLRLANRRMGCHLPGIALSVSKVLLTWVGKLSPSVFLLKVLCSG